jgi:UDP-N-acetylglucosamine:LPS N-acetylglucosamine transferase
MLRVLVLSFYYQPDLCAGSFRCSALVKYLSSHDIEIHVVTTAPNRYSSFDKVAPKFEKRGNIKVHRIPMPAHKSGMFDQINAFRAYYNGAQKIVKNESYDLVFATSSRLFTAFLGARIAKKKKLPLYLDVRDIFVDTMDNILTRNVARFVMPVLKLIERYTFNSAKHINLVSQGFLEYFKEQYSRPSFSFYTNGIDEEFIEASMVGQAKHNANAPITVLYAGNIGAGQGLDSVVPELAQRLKNRIRFKIIGDGGQRNVLKKTIKNMGLDNVELLPPVDRDTLINEYIKADVLFLHLNDYPAFKKVLPSKLFEYAAIGKPIWAGLNGYSAAFVCSEVTDCGVFLSGDIADAIEKFDTLKFNIEPRFEFIQKFSREKIMNKMALDILRVAKDHA